MLLLERLLALENETPLRKQEKPPPERESVQLHQEKVLEEKPQGDLLEDEDDRIFFSFFIYIWYELMSSLFISEIAIWNTEANAYVLWNLSYYYSVDRPPRCLLKWLDDIEKLFLENYN